MNDILRGRVHPGENNASHWLALFNDAYTRKTKMAIFPGSLNLAIENPFDWNSPRYKANVIWFGRDEYSGERDILMLPCVLRNLNGHRAFLWSTTNAVNLSEGRRVIEIITDVKLRDAYSLSDDAIVEVEVLVSE